MAFRSWVRVLLTAAGVGLLVAAGQLGTAYGLGIVRFSRTFAAAERDEWTTQVAWVVWFAVVAAVLGALAGARLATRYGVSPGPAAVIAVTICGGIGAGAVAPLAMLPADTAVVPGVATAPVVGVSVLIGVLVGMLTSVAVLLERAIRWNVLSLVCAGWLLALVSIAPSLGPTDELRVLRPGVFEPAWLADDLRPRLAVLTMPALALVAGAVVGWVARRRGSTPVAAAAAGLSGPVLLASAYLVAGPGDGAGRLQDASYWGAVVAVAAGLLGAVLAVVVHPWNAPAEGPEPAEQPTDDAATAEPPKGRAARQATTAEPPAGRAARQATTPEPPAGHTGWQGAAAASPSGPVRTSGVGTARPTPARATAAVPAAPTPRTPPEAATAPPPVAARSAPAGSNAAPTSNARPGSAYVPAPALVPMPAAYGSAPRDPLGPPRRPRRSPAESEDAAQRADHPPAPRPRSGPRHSAAADPGFGNAPETPPQQRPAARSGSASQSPGPQHPSDPAQPPRRRTRPQPYVPLGPRPGGPTDPAAPAGRWTPDGPAAGPPDPVPPTGPRAAAARPAPAGDDEYVDWVSGLSRDPDDRTS